MENNIEVLKQVLKSFGYRHTSSPNVFEKPLGFTRICVKIKNDIDKGLILEGEIVAFRNGEGTICHRIIYLLYITDDDQIDMTTIKVDKSVKRFEVEFEGTATKVTKVVVELKENNQSMNEVKNE